MIKITIETETDKKELEISKGLLTAHDKDGNVLNWNINITNEDRALYIVSQQAIMTRDLLKSTREVIK